DARVPNAAFADPRERLVHPDPTARRLLGLARGVLVPVELDPNAAEREPVRPAHVDLAARGARLGGHPGGLRADDARLHRPLFGAEARLGHVLAVAAPRALEPADERLVALAGALAERASLIAAHRERGHDVFALVLLVVVVEREDRPGGEDAR